MYRTVTVANTGSEPLHVLVSKATFSQAADGTIFFTDRGPYSAASWVTATPTAMELSPGELQPVRLRIARPPDPEPGEHQIGVIFLVPAQRAGPNVAIHRGVGAQVLIGVPGAVDRRIAFGRLRAPWLADGGPVRLTLPVHDRGNVHRDYLAGDRLVAEAGGDRVPFPDFTVLRGSTREVSTEWSPPLACVCRVQVVGDDGRGGRLVASARVVVFPFRAALGLVVLVLGLALLARGLRHRGRRVTAAEVAAARQEAYEQARRDLAVGDGQPVPSIPDRS